MIGLRVRVRGGSPVTMALPQDAYLVSAGASWRRQSPRKRAQLQFHGGGIDDRDDHLRWLSVCDPACPFWMDIVVVDAGEADAPRRLRRRRIDWAEAPARWRAMETARAKELQARLRRVKAGIPFRAPTWPERPPVVGLRVTLNGRELGRVGVSDPGSLGVDVYVRHRPEGDSIVLTVLGGDHIGERSWRWRAWPWNLRRLRVGDRVRIEVIAPVRLSLGRVRERTVEVSEAADIERELAKARARESIFTRRDIAMMRQADRERPPPRRYGRARSVERVARPKGRDVRARRTR